MNPFTFSLLLLGLGAERAWAIDLDPIQDYEMAIRARVEAVGWLLWGQERLLGQAPILHAEDILRNLH